MRGPRCGQVEPSGLLKRSRHAIAIIGAGADRPRRRLRPDPRRSHGHGVRGQRSGRRPRGRVQGATTGTGPWRSSTTTGSSPITTSSALIDELGAQRQGHLSAADHGRVPRGQVLSLRLAAALDHVSRLLAGSTSCASVRSAPTSRRCRNGVALEKYTAARVAAALARPARLRRDLAADAGRQVRRGLLPGHQPRVALGAHQVAHA